MATPNADETLLELLVGRIWQDYGPLVNEKTVENRHQRSFVMTRLIVRTLGFAFLWAILTGCKGWGVGIPVILLATAVSFQSLPANRWSFGGLARFLPYFAWNSLRGGVDVAARALNPRLPIDPAVLRYKVSLDSAEARVLMANTVTLLPGTLSADLQGNVLLVHVLNASGPFQDTLVTLEKRIADLVRANPDASAR